METIPKDEVCRMICKYCIEVNKCCQHRWDCPLLTEIAKYKDEPSNSEIPNNCEDEPQKIGYCNECKWFRDKQVCGRCRSKNLYAPKDEPQEEVIRCKDCKHSDTVTYPSGITEMTCPIMFETDCDDPFCVSWLIVDPNDFCSYGEVRDE